MTSLSVQDAFSSFAVDDVARAHRFYAEVLELDVSESPMGLELRLEGGTRVFIYPKHDHVPATFTVLNLSVDDIEQAVETLEARRVSLERYDLEDLKTDERGIHDYEGMKIAWFRDPAGNILSIIQERPQ